VSSEGEARLENWKRTAAEVQEKSEFLKVGAEKAFVLLEQAFEAAKDMKEKYDDVNDNYTASVMKNIKEE
jgi:hypothetical protein